MKKINSKYNIMEKSLIDDSKFIEFFKDNVPTTVDEFADLSIKNKLGGPKSINWWKTNNLLVWETIYERIQKKIEQDNKSYN